MFDLANKLNIHQLANKIPIKYVYIFMGGLFLSASFIVVWQKYLRGDSPAHIRQSMNNLLMIHRALMDFQSEAYFGRPPTDLRELYIYRTTFYIEKSTGSGQNEQFTKINKSYAMLPDLMAFRCPTKSHSEDKFSTDYTILPWYRLFLQGNTVIAWDNPGNFKSGGNLLFYDGSVRFYEMTRGEYQRFIDGVKSRSDREFLRAKCAEMSLRNFSNIRKADDAEAQRILDQATGARGNPVPVPVNPSAAVTGN